MHLNDHRFRFFFSSSVFCFFSFLFFFSRTRESYAYCVFFGIVSNNILSPLVFKMCRHVLDRAKKFICLCFLGAFSVFFLPLSLSLFCFSLTYFLLLLLNEKKKICFHLLCPSTNLYCSKDRALHDFVCRWRGKYKQRIWRGKKMQTIRTNDIISKKETWAHIARKLST